MMHVDSVRYNLSGSDMHVIMYVATLLLLLSVCRRYLKVYFLLCERLCCFAGTFFVVWGRVTESTGVRMLRV